MKLECLKDKLKEVINLTDKISSRNLSLPILSAVLLEAKKKTLVIKSTNLEIGLEVEIPAKVEIEGVVAVNANILMSFLNNLNKENKISLEVKDGNLQITTESSKTLIKSFNHEDFPIIPKINQENGFEINADIFLNGIQSVSFASTSSDIKPEISSVYIYNQENEVVFAGTDSFRLAEKTTKINDFSNTSFGLIIPFKSISDLTRVLGLIGQDKVMVSYNKNQMAVQTDNIYLTLRVIDGSYPDYKQIIPSEFKTELNIKKEDLVGLLKLTSVFSDRFNQVDFNLKPKENLISLLAYNQEIGENKTNFTTKIKGADLEISFNAKYLIDCLNSFSDNVVNLKFTEANKPLMIEGVSDYSFRYLVMPVNR